MAVLGRIRKHGWLLLVIVGVAMLAFILGDLVGSGQSVFSNSQNEVGLVAGNHITIQYFEQRYQEDIENYKLQTGNSSVDQSTTDLFREQAWTQILNEIILGKEYKETGIAVHPNEIIDMMTGANPHNYVIQYFTNPQTGRFYDQFIDPQTGGINTASVVRYLKNIQNLPAVERSRWLRVEDGIRDERIIEKYFNLIKKGLYATTREGKKDYEFKERTANIRYVVKKYSDIADEEVSLTDEDLKKYYKEHKNDFKQESSRTIEYVSLSVAPTPEDTAEVQKWIEKIRKEIEDINNAADLESYTNLNADTRFDANYYGKGLLSDKIDTLIFNGDSGIIVGPYFENGSFKVAKLVEIDFRPDSIKARHILIGYPQDTEKPKEAAIAFADSMKKLIENGSDFAQLAFTNSQDQGSKTDGGDLGWFAEGTMVKPFNDSCFASEKGKLLIVESQFGVHLIEILDMLEPVKKARVAIVDRKIEPSSQTFAAIYGEAGKIASSAGAKGSLDDLAKEKNLVLRIAENIKEGDKTIVGLESPRELVRWAFKAEEGNVSEPFELGNSFVIVRLTQIKDKGHAPLEQAKTQIEIEVRKEKKAEKIIEKIKANGDSNIDDMAKNLGVTTQSASNISFSQFSIPGLGREPQVIGNIFALGQGNLSKPIKGEAGVYVISIESLSEPDEKNNYLSEKARIMSNLSGRVDYEVFEALKDKANVTDNRYRFY